MLNLKKAISQFRVKKNPTPAELIEFVASTVEATVSAKVKELFEDVEGQISDAIEEIASTIHKGDKGDKGERGEKGDSIAGPAGPMGQKPIAGKDYPVPKDGKNIKGDKGDKGDKGKDGSPDSPIQIADKLNTLKEKVERFVIKGLDKEIANIYRAIKEGGGRKEGGGMGNWIHQSFSVSSATTTVTLSYKPAANGYALLIFYNGQFLIRGTSYTNSNKTITLLFTPQDDTYVDVAYVRT